MIVRAEELHPVFAGVMAISRFREIFPDGCELNEANLDRLQSSRFHLSRLFGGLIVGEYLDLIRPLDDQLIEMVEKSDMLLELPIKWTQEQFDLRLAVLHDEIKRLILVYAQLR